MNVAIYLRKSREEETETREETLARHERILLDFCCRSNLNIIKTYKEVVSGESIEKRPQMIQLLEDVSKCMYDGVVVVELERLSRGNQIDQCEILEIFKKSKTKIFTLNKTYDLSSDDEFDEEFFEFGLFMSRREYKIIKRRLQRGKKQALKEGYYSHSNPPYGFSKERQGKGFVLIPHPVEGEIVKTIFYKYAVEGEGIGDICRWLYDNGIKPRYNKGNGEWNHKRLRRMFTNKTYLGYIATDYIKGVPSNYIEGKHEPLIDDEIFKLANERLESNKTRVVHNRTLVNPIASFTKCGKCGKTLALKYSVNKQHHYLKCPSIACDNISTPLQYVEKQLYDELREYLNNFIEYSSKFSEIVEEKEKANQIEIDLILKEINKKEGMLLRCDEMLEEGIYSKEKYVTRVNILNKDITALKSNLEEIKASTFDEYYRSVNAIPIMSKVLDEYWNLNPTEKNNLLKTIIEKVEYVKNTRNTRHNPTEILFDLKIFLKI